ADANFRQLQGQLAEVEDQLQMARRYYNGTARDLNTLVQSFLSRGCQSSIDWSSSIPRWSAKRAKGAIEASTVRSVRETTQVRRRNRASQRRWREWSRSMPCVSSLPTDSRPCGISS